MELSNIANDFVGSNLFSVVMLLLVAGVGLFLRLSLHQPDEEYKHRRYKED